MATATANLTFAQFQEQYRNSDRAYEFWYGEAIPKGMPTWMHGLLQKIIMKLLDEAGYDSASDVELRIDLQARPRPDVIAAKRKPNGLYPTEAVEVVVEILSQDDSYRHLKDKARKYQEWGCASIFVVDPSDRSVAQWKDGAFLPVTVLAGVESSRIWQELDLRYPPA
jgi:Uma2 family endonuclease